VLENPFVRLSYLIDPASLCVDMAAAGFRLYSSWPRYDGGLDVHWFKREPTAEEQLRQELDFIARSRLSHMFGRSHFLVSHVPAVDSHLRSLLDDFDHLIDRFDDERAARSDETLAQVAGILASEGVLSSAEDRELSLATIEMLRNLVSVLARGSDDAIVSFCNSDPAFIGSWGTPSHFTVFRKASER
jgi:hypothetical protein